MLNEIRTFSYGEARYYVMKEIDTQGPIGRILTTIVPQLSLIMIRVCEQIDKLHAWNPGDDESGLVVSKDTEDMFLNIQSALPSLILTEDTLPWNDFMSAWCALINEYCSTYGSYAEYKLQQNGQDQTAIMTLNAIQGIEQTMDPIMRLVHLGAGYMELLKASANIVKELKSWRQSRPASLRLSQAYLTAMGLIAPEQNKKNSAEAHEGPQDCNNPPPPPPPPGDNGGNNPPPPPPPPPPAN